MGLPTGLTVQLPGLGGLSWAPVGDSALPHAPHPIRSYPGYAPTVKAEEEEQTEMLKSFSGHGVYYV